MATINRMHSVHYRVKVPDNVGPGELFNATLGSANKTYTLRCPEGVRSGSMVDVAVSSNPDGTESAEASGPGGGKALDTSATTSEFLGTVLGIWGFMVLVTMIVLILSYALPKFAVQHIGSSCGATNPLTGAPINILYYNVLHGLGSSPQCTNNATTADFCIEWNSFNIWTRIDQVTHKTDMQFDARLRWQATKVLIPASFSFCFIGLVLLWALYAIVIGEKTGTRTTTFGLANGVVACLFTTFGLSFAALNEVVYTNSVKPEAWIKFYEAGYPLNAVINNLVSTTTPKPTASCDVTFQFAEGAILLAIGTSLAFMSTVVMCGIYGNMGRKMAMLAE